MNQEKIGKYIAKCRKEKKLTQLELAEQLGCSDKSVSKWENGKCMPDLSLFNPLCEILGITVNDLMSGEKVDDKEYINTLEQNIVNMAADSEKRRKKKKRIIIMIFVFIFVFIFLGILFYNNYELDVKYDSRVMKCKIEDNKVIFETSGLSVLNYEHTIKNIDGKKVYFFHSTIYLTNKRHSNWEYSQSMARLLEGKETYGHHEIIDDDAENIVVYYTDESIRKINKMNDNELIKVMDDSYLMCNS